MVESRPRVLFNPDMCSANFFIPGLMVILCQMMATMLSATAIVREKENGTLEQLFMTPLLPHELVLGKLLPYLALTLVEFCAIALLMRTVFQVPVAGYFLTLLAITLPFVFTMIGIGLWISTRVSTREAAMQLTMGTILPSVFLSGYIFQVPPNLGTSVYGINDLGQIVGAYGGPDSKSHGFLATPVPEPSTLLLLAIGTLGVIGWTWRRR